MGSSFLLNLCCSERGNRSQVILIFFNLQKANSDHNSEMQALLLQVVITQGSKTYSSKGVLSRHRFGATSLNPQLRLPVMVTTPQGRGQTPNTSLIPTASTRSTLQQDIQHVLELCKCWAQSLSLRKVLNNSKSLQEATSKVLRETDLLVQQICTCPSVKMKLIPAQGIILHPPHWFSMLF